MLEAETWKSMRDSLLFIVNACNWGREIPHVFRDSLNFKSVGNFPCYVRSSNHLSYLMGTGHKIWNDHRPHVEMPDCLYHERAITCDLIVICSEIWEIGESAVVNYGATWTPAFNRKVNMLDVFSVGNAAHVYSQGQSCSCQRWNRCALETLSTGIPHLQRGSRIVPASCEASH